MATKADEPTAAAAAASHADSIANSSDSDSDPGDAHETPVEWLATGRAKRSTAGNRMKSMLATETTADEDSDLELLFQEDDDDVGFTEKEDDDGSDVAMESSDDEDENEAQDDDAGEKELERQAKEKRVAARKRKAQEAIPAKFRKKVRIHPPDASSVSTVAAAPPSRPKKKSERASWLPTQAELPTRASGRKTTQLSKEQLHQQMIEREARRLKQVELMERQAKKKEAMKKPPMTQAERLREAAIVEKRNAKSLNRWEEAEKQREEERRAKLAALNNRRLEGPVVTFWTGIIDLSEVQLKHVGKMVSMEEKPRRKRPSTAAGKDATSTADERREIGSPAPTQAAPTAQDAPSLPSRPGTPREPEISKTEPTSLMPMAAPPPSLPSPTPIPAVSTGTPSAQIPATAPPPQPSLTIQPTTTSIFRPVSPAATLGTIVPAPSPAAPQSSTFTPPIPSPIVKAEPQNSKPLPLALRPDTGPRFMPPPNPHFAHPMQPSPLASPASAPSGLTGASGGYQANPTPHITSLVATGPAPGSNHPQSSVFSSNIQNTHRPSPPATLNTSTAFTNPFQHSVLRSPLHTTASFQPIVSTAPSVKVVKKPLPEQAPSKKSTGKASAARKPQAPPESPTPEPPMEGKVTRSCIILQNFDEDAIKKPDVQTQILFGWKMNKAAKPLPPALCVITNQPARYRDPRTGLPYYNLNAYKEIQRLIQGNFHWSKLLGTWVGDASYAATGVPDRFTRPETEAERKERLERKDQLAEEQKKAAEAAEAAKTSGLKIEESTFAPVSGVDIALADAPPPLAAPASLSASALVSAAPIVAPSAPVGPPPAVSNPALGAPISGQPEQAL